MKNTIIMRAIIGASIGAAIAAVGGGILAVAANIVQFPVVRDMTIVTGEKHSNWQRNELMFLAKDKCRGIEAMGGGLSAVAVRYHLRDATPTELAQKLGRVFVETKHACPQYSQFFRDDYANLVLSIHGWEEQEVYQVLGQKSDTYME